MRYWLFKSEPNTFSIDDLSHCSKQTVPWDGVRNYQVRNMLRDEIKKGDLGFFYHSSCKRPGVAGVVEVVKEGQPDVTAWSLHSPYYDPTSSPERPRWFMVEVKLVKKFSRFVPLDEIKKQTKLNNMLIVRQGNRLSITPVTTEEWKVIMHLANECSSL
jgi:predicted RNA-binding protein with PUA-like domain